MINQKYDILSKKELENLLIKYKKGDIDARNKMVKSMIPLTMSLVSKFPITGSDIIYDDMLQSMFIEIIKAIDRWNPKIATLTTHVYWAISYQLLNYVNEHNRSVIKVGRHMKKKVKEWDPKTEKQESVLIKAKSCMDYVYFSEIIASRKSNLQKDEEPLERKFNIEYCHNLINSLKTREKEVLEMRFGLNKHYPHTLKEVGQKIGVSKERVRQIQKRSLEKLRNVPQQKI